VNMLNKKVCMPVCNRGAKVSSAVDVSCAVTRPGRSGKYRMELIVE
jgi:hypothetical protein